MREKRFLGPVTSAVKKDLKRSPKGHQMFVDSKRHAS